MTPARLEEVERDLKQIRQCYDACVPPSVMRAAELLAEVKRLREVLESIADDPRTPCMISSMVARAALAGEEPTP